MGELGGELGGNSTRLVPLAADQAHEAGVIGFVIGAGGLALGAFEQAAGLVSDEQIVTDALQGGQRLGARLASGMRHVGLLVPVRQSGGVTDVSQLGQT